MTGMNQYGTSSRTMIKILYQLSAEKPIPTLELAAKIQMSEANMRRALANMVELELVEKVKLPPPKRSVGKKPITTAWLKYPPRAKSLY